MLRLAGREIPLKVARHAQARHISLRVDGAAGAVRLILPRRAALREGLEFAEYKSAWLLDQLDALPARIPFGDGAVVPILGQDHVIRHDREGRRGVWRAKGVVWASGHAEHLPRRIADFLKAEARRELAARARSKAAKIQETVHRVSVRETRTRWGSCGSDGTLNFCWRLILTPVEVLDYVVAHEVAHLKHMNHGPRFWELTERLTVNAAEARAWLRQHGDRVLRYG
jgi:predicted metal-dependent hydrolase